MNTKKRGLAMAVAVTLALLGNVVQASAQTAKPEIILSNGLGAEITELSLSPSKDQYAKNRNCYARAIQVNDKVVFSVEIPEHFLGYESFDIEVVSGGKRHATHKGVKLDFNKGMPVLELSKTGKDSTNGFIKALTAAGGSIIFLTATKPGRQLLANIVLNFYRWKGIAVTLMLPTAAGTAGYIIDQSLAPEGLDVQVAYIN